MTFLTKNDFLTNYEISNSLSNELFWFIINFEKSKKNAFFRRFHSKKL